VTFRDLEVGVVDFGPIVLLGIDFTGGTPSIPDPSLPSNTLIRPQDLGGLGDDPLVKSGPYGPVGVLLHAGGGMAGVSDLALARMSHHATAKRRFLEQTQALRSKLATEHRRATERAALASLEAQLDALWDAADSPAPLRRARIFQRWDDCVELPDDPRASDEQRARGRAGERARRRIAAWIREHLPRARADAFTAEELRGMNARRLSRARFDPYADPQGLRPAEPAADVTSGSRGGARRAGGEHRVRLERS
jgi:hypothetical protein